MRVVKVAVGLVVVWAVHRAWTAADRPADGRNRTPHKVHQPVTGRPRAKARAGTSGR